MDAKKLSEAQKGAKGLTEGQKGAKGLTEGQKGVKGLTEGQRAYEAKRAAKAGMSLEAWLRDKEKRAKAEAAEAAKVTSAEPAKKPGFFSRLLERAQKPL